MTVARFYEEDQNVCIHWEQQLLSERTKPNQTTPSSVHITSPNVAANVDLEWAELVG